MEEDIPDEFCLGCGLHSSHQHPNPLAKVRCPLCGSEVEEDEDTATEEEDEIDD